MGTLIEPGAARGPPGQSSDNRPQHQAVRPLSHFPGTQLTGSRNLGAAGGLLTAQRAPNRPERQKPSTPAPAAAITARKRTFTTTPTMPTDYSSQSASRVATFNPVVAQEQASPAPLPTPNCCSYFHPHSPKLCKVCKAVAAMRSRRLPLSHKEPQLPRKFPDRVLYLLSPVHTSQCHMFII